VIMHNTLAASDYALIDQDTLSPRPNYWAAVLWAKVMGTTVLAAPKSPTPELRLFAHCLKGQKGGVGLLALNTGSAAQSLKVGDNATAWVMSGAPIDTRAIKINGGEPSLDDKGALVGLDGVAAKGALAVPGQSIAFVAVRDANNKACS
jgi:heparanase